jgi:hypothetical protein
MATKKKKKTSKRPSNKASKPIKQKQLGLGLKQPVTNTFAKAKGNIRKNLRILEIKRFIRSPYSWIFISLSISLIGIQAFYLLTNLDKLPDVLPIYFNTFDLDLRLGNQIELLIFPILSVIIVIATTLTGYQLYNSHRELITFGLLNMMMSVAVLTFVLLEIFAVYL